MVQPVHTRITTEEFFELSEKSDDRMELINGEVIIMGTPTPGHQDIVGNIFFLLKQFQKEQGGKAYVSQLEVVLGDDIVQPDVMYIASNSQCEIGDKRLYGAPDLVVEIFSPSTAQRDKTVKFDLYEQHGSREYWMIDPLHQYVEVYCLQDGKFNKLGVFIPEENFESPALGGKKVEVKTIFAN